MVNVLRRGSSRHKKQMSREQMEGLRRYITTTTINFSDIKQSRKDHKTEENYYERDGKTEQKELKQKSIAQMHNYNNQNVDKYFAKEVQATLPLTFYIYIFDEIDSQYHKYFRAVLFSAPPQVYTYRLTNTSGNFAMTSTSPNQNEIIGIQHLKK